MEIVIVGKRGEQRVVLWGRVVLLALILSAALGLGTGALYRVLSGAWEPVPFVLGAFLGLVVVGTGVVRSIKEPLQNLKTLE